MKSTSLLSFVRELVIVIIGILIALFINKCNEDANNQKFIQTVLNTIQTEIKQSKVDLDTIIPKHTRLFELMEEQIENDTVSILDIAEEAGGVQYPEIKNISLRFFVASKAELIDYATISALTEIESGKGILDKKFEKLMDYSYEHLNATDEKSKISFIVRLADVIDSEIYLNDLYDNFLAASLSSKRPNKNQE